MATVYTFDGAERLITMSGTPYEIDVKDMYSRWKQWAKDTDGAKNAMAFDSVGGNVIDAAAGTAIPAYIYIKNGWGIRPQEVDHTLNVINGVLLREGGGDPFEDTVGAFTVRVNYQQPVQAISVGIGQIYADINNVQAMRLLIDAMVTGKIIPPGSLPGVLTGRDKDDTKDRFTATVAADGTRTPISYDPD
jgi:hypothetical protein